ncbi:MAG: hypothetical protein ABR915_00060 [Thermoguttaceae bacterium]|jgi:hypothetical protein
MTWRSVVFGKRGTGLVATSLCCVLLGSQTEGRAVAAEPPPTIEDGATFRLGGLDYKLAILRIDGIGRTADFKRWCLWSKSQRRAWIIDPLKPALDESFACPEGVLTVSDDRKWAAVPDRQSKPGRGGTAILDLRSGQRVVESETLFAQHVVFSPDGRYAFPADGYGPSYAWFDLGERKVIERTFRSEGGRHQWRGALIGDGKTLCLMVGPPEPRTNRQWRILLPLADPEKLEIQADANNVDRLYGYVAEGDKAGNLLVDLRSGPNREVPMLLSTKTWTVRPVGPPFEVRIPPRPDDPTRTWTVRMLGVPELFVLSAAPSFRPALGREGHLGWYTRVFAGPDGRHIYRIERGRRGGLNILDASGKPLDTEEREDRDGRPGWGNCIGLSFSSDGRYAVVGSPVGNTLAIIDTKTLEAAARLRPRHRGGFSMSAVGGGFLIAAKQPGDPGTCLIVELQEQAE